MNILEKAILEEGGVEKLAASLGLVQTAIYNWRARGVPRSWAMALSLKYKSPDIPWGVLRGTKKPSVEE